MVSGVTDQRPDELEAHRPALLGHCYRMLGSPFDAEDAVQETMVRAWRGLSRFDGRAALGTWLHRIATNVCLDQLAKRSRRHRPAEEGPPGEAADASRMQTLPGEHWVEPIPDSWVVPRAADPVERAALRQSVRLAFVAALQRLPPRQRAALLLTEVLGWSASEVAETLGLSVASVNSALQRARKGVAGLAPELPPTSLTDAHRELLERFVAAFEAYDVPALTALLASDVVMSMPPHALWLKGPDSVAAWLSGPGIGCSGSRLVAVEACGVAAFAQYRRGGAEPWAIVVPELGSEGIVELSYFLDAKALFPAFGLPLELRE